MRLPSTILILTVSVISLAGALTGQARIAEFMAQNNLVLADAEGDWPDWIEIENTSAGAVDLGGWYLTDSSNNTTKWQFPKPTVLGAKQRLLVFASGKNRAVSGKQLHTSFKLSSGGEYLGLVTPNLNVISQFAPQYPPQFADVSYGIDTSGPGHFPKPTPGKPNGTTQPVIGDMKYSPLTPKSTDPILVTAEVVHNPNAPPVSVELRYRMNFGAESKTSMRDDGLGGDLRAGDHIWTGTIPGGNTAGSMLRWRVIATFSKVIATGPMFKSPTNSPQYCGTSIADPSVHSALPILQWWVQNPAAAGTQTGTRCAVAYEGHFRDNVQVRRRGGSSKNWRKRNFKFDFNRGYPLLFAKGSHEAEEVNANSTWGDKSFVRQTLSYETYDRAGVAGSIAFPIRMEQNGQFHSVAIFVEQPDERLLEREGLDPRGAFYKMYNTLTSATSGVEKKTRTWESNSDLQALVSGVTLTGQPLEHFLFDHVDLPAVLNYIAATVLIHDQDHVHKNHYLYRDTEGDGEWRFLPWDKDLTIGRNYFRQYGVLNDILWADQDPASHPLYGDRYHRNPGARWNRLIDACHNTPRIRAMFLRHLRTLLDELLQPPGIPRTALWYERQLDQLKKLLDPDVALDRKRWGVPSWGNQSYDFATSLLRIENSYFQPRRRHLFVTHSSNPGGIIPARQTVGVKLVFGAIEANPASNESFIEIVNDNTEAVDLTGWRLDGGVTFHFAAGTVIPAKESAFLSPDPRAFRARSSNPRGGQGLFVIGPYSGNLMPNEAISLYDASNRLIANIGGVAYDLSSQSKGDLDLKVSGVAAGSRLFIIFSADTRHRLGCGPLLGMGMDALGTLTLPLNSQPFHVLANNNGEYRFSARPGTLPRQLTVDSRVLLLDFQAKKLLTSRILRVTF